MKNFKEMITTILIIIFILSFLALLIYFSTLLIIDLFRDIGQSIIKYIEVTNFTNGTFK